MSRHTMRRPILPVFALLISTLVPLTTAQQQPDGLIVPFTSVLPVCATSCGTLYDVQGACVPPIVGEVSTSCFCADSRLKSFGNSGTAGISSICASCTTTDELQKLQSWYQTLCNIQATPTTSAGSGGSSTSSTSTSTSKPKPSVNQTWIQGHWKWVIMLVILVVAIVGGWIVASCLRRRYIRNKEKAFEMRPPVAWGPHQMQGATNGYNYGDGVADSPGGHNKEVGAPAIPLATQKRESKGWLRKERT